MSKLMLAARDGFLDSFRLALAIPLVIVSALAQVAATFLRASREPRNGH